MKELQVGIEQEIIGVRVSPWRLLWIWAVVGTQSFGGGSATLYLIRRVAVERYKWLTEDEFTHYWSICQIVPGINILGIVILIGSRVSGVPGAILGLCGLLLPSAAITVTLTALYASFRETPFVRAAIAGVVPATVGLGLLVGYTMVRPLIDAARRESRVNTVVAVMMLLGSTLVAAMARIPVLAILWGAGALSAVAQWRYDAREGPSR